MKVQSYIEVYYHSQNLLLILLSQHRLSSNWDNVDFFTTWGYLPGLNNSKI